MVYVLHCAEGMGNFVVSPPFSDWYVPPLKKHGVQVQEQMDSGTFFMVLQARDQAGNDVVVKAYQFYEPLEKYRNVTQSQQLLSKLEEKFKETPGIINYSIRAVQDNMAFLVRPKFDRTLVDIARSQQPGLKEAEKIWIFYQLVTQLKSLHDIDLFHGDIKPSNIFIEKGLYAKIGDLAPFKPAKIDPQRPHLFYHYFTTNSDTGCYMAPERLTSNSESSIDLQMADWFSVGCVMVYLFLDGRHLFDLAKMKEYASGNFDIDEALMPIEDELMRRFIKGMLKIDVDERRRATAEMLVSFPDFFMKFGTVVGNFKVMKHEDVFEFSSAYVHVKQLVENAVEYKSVVFDLLESELFQLTNLSDLTFAIRNVSEFILDYHDDFKLSRAIPLMTTLTEIQSTLVLRECLFAILKIIQSVKEIPEELTGYFDSYLKTELHSLAAGSMEQDSLSFAEFLPLIVTEMKRLEPKSIMKFTMAFSSVFAVQNITIFRVFANSLKRVAVAGGYKVLKPFFYFSFLAAFNYAEEFKEEILKILMAFYGCSSKQDFPKFKKQIANDVLLICSDISARNPSDELQTVVFEFFDFVMRRKMIDQNCGYLITPVIKKFMFSRLDETRYWVARLMSILPPDARDSINRDYILHRTEPAPVKRNLCAPRKSQFKIIGLSKLFDHNEETTIDDYSPAFICAFHGKSVPVEHIINTHTDSSVVTVDQGGRRLHWIDLPSLEDTQTREQQTKMTRETITSVASLVSEKSFCLGNDDGSITLFDLSTTRKTGFLRASGSPSITALVQHSGPTVLCGDADGSVMLYDCRDNSFHNKITFDSIGGVTDICMWPNGSTLAGVSFDNGVVTLVDTRIFAPLSFAETDIVKKLVPMSCKGKLSYLAMSDESVEIMSEPKTKHNIIYREQTPFRWAAPYRGGAVVVDDLSASFIANGRSPGVRLFDRQRKELSFASPTVIETEGMNKGMAASIHRHAGTVTCGTIIGNTAITCDNAGFMNIWRLAKSI